CGDGLCGPSEDCSRCPQDCGTCPTSTTTTTTTQAQVQCCGSPGEAFDGSCVVETQCDANHPNNLGAGTCSPNPRPTTTSTTLAICTCFCTPISPGANCPPLCSGRSCANGDDCGFICDVCGAPGCGPQSATCGPT